MNNLSILKPTFLFFFFFMPHLITIVTAAPRYTPIDDIALNCGTSANLTALNDRQWTGDKNSKVALIEQSNNKSATATANIRTSSVDTVPFMTARISRSQFTYSFSVTPGQKFIRLYFYSSSYSPDFDKNKDFFTVKAGPFILLQNFSPSIISAYVGQTYFFNEYYLNVEEGDQKLNITFTPTHSSSNDSYAFINGIEIVSMPTSLYYTSPSDDKGLPVVGQNNSVRIENDTALEMVYRLNVGIRTISSMEDTGMYRTWYDDTSLMDPLIGVLPTYPNIPLTWSKIPNYTAPDDIYQTVRSMGPNKTLNKQANMTWRLTVNQGYWYLVRLHFCEFEPLVKAIGDRQFRVYIDNKTAEKSFDVMESSGKDIPMYMDYVVLTENNTEDQGDYYLFITLHPNNVGFVDAILNGIEVFRLSNYGSLAIPNPIVSVSPAPAVQPTASPAQKSKTKKTWIIAGVGSAVGLTIVLTLLCCMVMWQLRRRKRYGSSYKPSWCWWWLDPNKGTSLRTTASSLPNELCRQFSLAEIKAATNNFHDDLVIGVGGFGNVFKGFMDEGSMVVAIKRLKTESKQGVREFRTEIEMLSQLRHVHLVSLIGYCNDESEMILVYEFMMNGTLRDHLYDTKNDPLPWKQRLQICKGAAIGLHYLHAEVEHTIIHRDVKTTNILLDEKWTAKVSDFGLSKIDRKTSMVNTVVKGTWGYLDPEYARGHPLTEKSDVYSFGVVLFEVLCARKALDGKLGGDQANIVNWARKCIDNGTFYQIIDPYLMGKIAPECFKVFLEIAQSCVIEEGIKRPTMKEVMERLTFALELQEKADTEIDRKYPGGEYEYASMSFPVARYDIVDSGTDIDSTIGCMSSTIVTNTTGMSSTSHDSASASDLGHLQL